MTPYATSLEHLQDELRRLDLLLQRYLAAWRADRGGAGEGGGLYVADEQVDRLLRAEPRVEAGQREDHRAPRGDGGASQTGAAPGHPEGKTDPRRPGASDGAQVGDDVGERLRALTTTIRQREAETLDTGTELPLVSLAEQFGLDRRHVDALLVALAPELDLKYETVYAYLQDDLTRKRPTVGLALRVVGGTVGSEADHRPLFTPGSPLLDAGFLEPVAGDGPLLSRPVHVDRRIVAHLLGEDELDPALEGIAESVNPNEAFSGLRAPDFDGGNPIERLPVVDRTRERLQSLAERVDGDPPTMVHLHGPYGSGRSAAAMALSAAVGRPLVRADAERILADGATGTLDRLAREARLREGAVHVRNLPRPDHEREGGQAVDLTTLVDRLDRFDGPVFLSRSEPLPPRLAAGLTGHGFATVAFERPTFDLRRSLWEQAGLPGDPSELASKFRFTPGQIRDAIATAQSLADGEPTAEDVYEACRVQSRERLGDLARHVEPTFGWDDIVLPDDERRQLQEVAAHIEHQGTVYSEWGFEDRFSLGTGVNVLFAGPSGTGKTMAAEILAGEAGLDLYKVDLANVVSKYIGETESNLGQVFDEAESSNAILFFDEADALFGERSEVSDAHDRYANVEVDYLLERMEEHDGVVLLATNLRENLDEAFQRRLNVTIEFPLPDREARERIWRGVFPEDTPVGDLDWAFLADFELTGGSIKNAALTAAFLAADEDVDGTVEMRHVVRGLWRELQKSGRLVSAEDFGEYQADIGA